MIVGLLAELECDAGVVWPAERRVIEMPRAVNETPRPRLAPATAAQAPVVSIRLEGERTSRVGKVVVGGVALGVAGCVLAISLSRGGVLATHAFYAPFTQADLPFTQNDNYSTVVRALGQPELERWRSLRAPDRNEQLDEQYELLAYPRRKLYVILMGRDRGGARYIGAMDPTWRPAHAVHLDGYGSSYRLLQRLPRF
jgi:hypothetical protein